MPMRPLLLRLGRACDCWALALCVMCGRLDRADLGDARWGGRGAGRAHTRAVLSTPRLSSPPCRQVGWGQY